MKKKLLIVVLFLLIIVTTASTYAMSKYNKMDYVDIPDDSEDLGINETNKTEEELNNIENILILGVDSRENEYSNTRSDVIMILSIDSKNKMFKITSVMRDTYLNIPDMNKFDKVNHAYAFGGGLYSIKAINSNMDLDCKEFVTFNFEVVEEIVDSLGGVEVEVESSELGELNRILEELNEMYKDEVEFVENTGLIELNGRQAVAYSRIRYNNGGDSVRTERQREVLSAAFVKFKTISISEVDSIANNVLPLISTSVDEVELLAYATKIAEYQNYTIESNSFPQEYDGFNHNSVYYAFSNTLQSEVENLHSFIYGDDEYKVSQQVKENSSYIESILNNK